jgi:hypothetical protein
MLRNIKIKICTEKSWNSAIVQNIYFVRFEVLMAMNMKMALFWIVVL